MRVTRGLGVCGFMSNSHNKSLTVSICSYLIEVECKFNLIHSAHQFKVDSFDTLHLVRDTLYDFFSKLWSRFQICSYANWLLNEILNLRNFICF